MIREQLRESFILIAYKLTIVLCLVSFFLGCNSEKEAVTNQPLSPVDTSITPDSFLQFDNPHASLITGDYSLVAATNESGVSDTYAITLEVYGLGANETSIQTFNGSWTNSNGPGLDNPSHSFQISGASGIKARLTSASDNRLYLVRNNFIIADDDNSGESTNASLNLPAQKINNQAYADAYYFAVDPENQRTTLADWKNLNGFNNYSQRITFRDSKDLGYGRDMFARRRADGGIAVFVDNYLVQTQVGDARSYGVINLDAAIAQNKDFHIGTNAIEFSPIDEKDPESDLIVKIFTFAPVDENGVAARITAVNLDGRGIKFMPTMCLACHGGTLHPLNPDGSFPEDSLRSAKFNILDATTFDFSTKAGFSLAEQQAGIKLVNQLALDTYAQVKQQVKGQQGEWNADFAIELVNGFYGPDMTASTFDKTFIPQGWLQDGFRPDGVELLFRDVVGPFCIGCHSLRGNDAGQSLVSLVDFSDHQVALANAINFSSFEKFISYSDLIIEKVYRRGRMPMSLINYDLFWKNPDAAPAYLASFLANFDVFDSDGKVKAPNRPVALPGGDRESLSPVQLDGSASVLSQGFNWQIITQPQGAVASLSSSSGITPTLNADLEGDYLLQLITSNQFGQSATKQFTVTINNSLSPKPTELTFDTDIRQVLNREYLGKSCSSCHDPEGDYPSIPVYYTDTTENLYYKILERIDFNEPENSILLRKPTGLQHGGGIRIDRQTVNGEKDYQTIINWIKNGAPCGDDAEFCD